MRKKRPKVAVVTLSWNSRDDVYKALKCLSSQTMKPNKIIVVDNGSTDGTVEMIKKEFPLIEIHALKKNIGYAAGYNLAFRLVPSNIKYVIVLDQDVTIERNYIKKVVERFEKEPESTIVLMCDLEEPLIKSFGLKEGYVKSFHGSCFSYRNMHKIHMIYDEKIFAYFNEADLCAQLLNKGFRILYYPGCKTIHKKDSTIMNPFRTYYMTRNVMWFYWKNTEFIDALLGSLISMMIFYSKASRYNSLPAYFKALFDATRGFAYCMRKRSPSSMISFKDIDDCRKISRALNDIGIAALLRPFDYIYEKRKLIRSRRYE